MSEEKSAFMIAREKALGLQPDSPELIETRLVAIPETLINIDPSNMMGWMKKKAPRPSADHLILTSDPDVLDIIRKLDVTIFSPEDS